MDMVASDYFDQQAIDIESIPEVEELERQQFLRNNSVDSLESFITRLESERVIAKSTANTIKTIGAGLESLDKHFAAHPVQSYTEAPSRTNYEVTMEGLLGAVSNATAKAMDASFAVISKINSELDKVYRENDTKYNHVVEKLPLMVQALKRRPPTADDRVPMSVWKLIKELSPLAKWLIAPGLDDEFTRRYGAPSYFVKAMLVIEQSIMKSVNGYLADGELRARDPNRFHELKALVGTRPESVLFFNSTFETGRPDSFAEALFDRASTLRNHMKRPIVSKVDEMAVYDTIASAMRWVESADIANVRLQSAKKYQTFHESVNKLRDTIVPIVRSGNLKSGEPRIGNNYLNDIRTLSKAVLEFELFLTEYRAAVMQVAKLLYVYGRSR